MASKGKAEKHAPKFKQSDIVVYPLQGVGIIQSIDERKFKGKKIQYYNIYIKTSDMTIMIPVSKIEELGIRPIISKRRAETLLNKIATEENYVFSSDWKMRYQNSMQQIKEGTLLEIARIVKAMYLRSKTKDLPIMERKLYDSSLQSLIRELALATNQPEDETRKLLLEKFNFESDKQSAD